MASRRKQLSRGINLDAEEKCSSVARTTGSKLERVPVAHVIEEAAERENDREAIRRWRENMDFIDGW
jgi:hypothetical protein